MANTKTDLAQKAIRLRIEERLSLREIAEVIGASKGALSVWLKPYPLTAEERLQRQKLARRFIPPKKDRGEISKFFQVTLGRTLSRQEKAKIAEAAVAFRLVLHGFTVYASPFDGDKADWVVEVPETRKIHTIQVRWARAGQAGLPYIGLQCTVGHSLQKRYLAGDFDFIVGYDLYSDTAFVYSAEEVSSLKATVSINWDYVERWDKLRS